jgi:hypothetical protein
MNKLRVMINIVLSTTLISCASSGPTEILSESGEVLHMTSCKASYQEQCYSQAGKICQPNGINIVNKKVDDGIAEIIIKCRK